MVNIIANQWNKLNWYRKIVYFFSKMTWLFITLNVNALEWFWSLYICYMMKPPSSFSVLIKNTYLVSRYWRLEVSCLDLKMLLVWSSCSTRRNIGGLVMIQSSISAVLYRTMKKVPHYLLYHHQGHLVVSSAVCRFL